MTERWLQALVGICVWLAMATRLPAQDQWPVIPEETPTVELTLRPAAPPVPALKYRFVRELQECKPGNAVPYYYRAIQLEQAVRRNEKPEVLEKWNSWLDKMPQELPAAEVRAWLVTRAQVLQ